MAAVVGTADPMGSPKGGCGNAGSLDLTSMTENAVMDFMAKDNAIGENKSCGA